MSMTFVKRSALMLAQCFCNAAAISAIIMQIGCGMSMAKQAKVRNKGAMASLAYGKSGNPLVAQRTGVLFY